MQLLANRGLGELGKQVLPAGVVVFSELLHDGVCREPLTFDLLHDFVPCHFVVFVPRTPNFCDFLVTFHQIVPNSICILDSFLANYLYLR